MKKSYGIPYVGSKNKIAEWVLSYLPEADNLYDLFGGGGAITHCAALLNKYKNIYYNDKNDIADLFRDAIAGKYKNENRWISREDYFKLRDSEPYIAYIWSFGNKGKDEGYMYSKEKEQVRKQCWETIFNDSEYVNGDDKTKVKVRRKHCKNIITDDNLHYCLVSLENLERLERLQRLNNSNITKLINISRLDYKDIVIQDNSVIYCDIPYRETTTKSSKVMKDYYSFDYDEFYNWAEKQKNIFISEYSMPEDRFVCIAQKEKDNQLSSLGGGRKKVEKLFIPKANLEDYNKIKHE